MTRILPFPLGLVVHDTDGAPWVYVGWHISTVQSRDHFFVKASQGKWYGGYPWAYHAVTVEALTRKFPDLAPHIKIETLEKPDDSTS